MSANGYNNNPSISILQGGNTGIFPYLPKNSVSGSKCLSNSRRTLRFSLVFFGFLNGDVKKKETELEQLSEYYDSVLEKNNELSYLLNDADENELFEQLARSHGYAYPDEKIYLDITPGK